jgi:hypothetical protein
MYKLSKEKVIFPFSRRWRLEGIIWLTNHPIDSVEVLCNGDIEAINNYYVLAYTIKDRKVDNVWTKRSMKFATNQISKIVWKGRALARTLNKDISLNDLLLKHLGTINCDICTTNYQGNTMILFGESYPRHWIKLPEEMFPSKERIEIVTKLAEHIRSA